MNDLFLIYGGSSCDGRGESRFLYKTNLRKKAEDHLREIQDNPYCFGYVVWVSEDFVKEIHNLKDFH